MLALGKRDEARRRRIAARAVGYTGSDVWKGGSTMGIGVSIFLLAVGAILAFAVNVPTDGIELDTVGVILIILGLVGLLASLVWWDDWMPRRRTVAYDDEGDVIVRRRRPRVVTIDDADDGVVDVVEDRPVVERRRVTTRRTSYDGF
jgi:hypothetical protein